MPLKGFTTENFKKDLTRPKRKRISDMRVDFRGLKSASTLRAGIKAAMYESSCSYAGALELKRSALKEEPWTTAEWPPYRLHQSTFEQLKQSVEKAKAALQDRSSLLGTATAFGDFYGGQIGQDGSTIGFGRAARTDESMLGTIDKGKVLGSDKLSGGLSKGYSTPTLSDTLRASKCAEKCGQETNINFNKQFSQEGSPWHFVFVNNVPVFYTDDDNPRNRHIVFHTN